MPYEHDRLAVAAYLATMTVSSACLTVMALLVWRRPGLRRTGVDARSINPRTSLLATATFVVALLLGMLIPAVNYHAAFLVLLVGPVESALRRRARSTLG